MCDKHGRDARLTLDPPDLFTGLQPEPRVQVRERFVEKQYLRHFHKRSRYRDALLLAAGHLARLAVEKSLDLNEPRGLFRLRDHFLLRHFVFSLAVLKREHDVLTRREMRVERVALEDHADAALFRRQLRHIVLPEVDFAVGRAHV